LNIAVQKIWTSLVFGLQSNVTHIKVGQFVVQKLNLAFPRIILRGGGRFEVLRAFWLVDTPGEKVSPHKIGFNVVSSLAFLFPLLESPLVIVFPHLRKPFSQIFQENGFSF